MKKYFFVAVSMVCMVCMTSVAAFADEIDISKIALERLRKTAAATNAAGQKLVGVKFLSTLETTGIKFKLPSAVPEQPFVLMTQTLSNNLASEARLKCGVEESSMDSETIGTSKTLGGETEVSLSYKSPVGLTVAGKQSFNYSTTKNMEKTTSKTRTWRAEGDFPVGPKERIDVQFVVSEKRLDNIPWSTEVIMKGPAELTYNSSGGPVEVCVYQKPNHGGHKKCWTTSTPINLGSFKKEKWDGGKGGMNDSISSIKITGNAKVTVYQKYDFAGWSASFTSSTNEMGKGKNNKVSSMKIEPQNTVTTVQIEKFLNTPALQGVALSGTYNGVSGVTGSFLSSDPMPLSSIRTLKSSKSSGSKSSPVKPSRETKPIKGKVVQSGIKSVN
ncbi:MAG TPA: peptidase inhibitor family I36 protein [Spirochaetota bacterium]|nr:peptidase inhibitor family I36 protein [Spirochaetota bacterium]HNT12171.1 peptidase inhibitor family I36 protein [Spirochaetota bacterium]